MLVMFDVTEPVGGADAMTRKQGKTSVIDVKALLDGDGDYLRAMVRAVRAGGARGGDDRGARCREGRAHRAGGSATDRATTAAR